MIGMKQLFTIFLFLISGLSMAQDRTDILLPDYVKIIEAQVEPAHRHRYTFHHDEFANELSLIVIGLYLGYKLFVSSQDSRSCVFQPSCSTYAIETLKKNGVLIGFLDTIDRLTRCHPFSMENYQIDEELQLLIDNP